LAQWLKYQNSSYLSTVAKLSEIIPSKVAKLSN
jgi:hypothetical protein